MPRYIDAGKLIKDIEENKRNTEHHKDGRGKQIHVGEHRHFLKMVHEQPTADVAPKSEVDLYKRLNEELEDELASTYDKLETAKAEVAREIFEEIEECCVTNFGNSRIFLPERFAELKKKYTEGET